MLQTCQAHVAACLVSYAQGNPQIKTVKPYGLKAARSTVAFKQVPYTSLALTFAALYQAVRTEEHMIAKWLKTPRHNITNPWPRGMIRRYKTLQTAFKKHHWEMFKAYESAGGEYMQDEEVQETPAAVSRGRPVEDFEEDF